MCRNQLYAVMAVVCVGAVAPGCHEGGGESEPHETDCTNGVDDDGDMLIDCDDLDCEGRLECARETTCDDGEDNDLDGQIDCEDSDCARNPACNESPDGDADSDADGDEDEEVDADEDPDEEIETVNGGCCGEITLGPECERDCSENTHFNRCERGICSNSGSPRECCVARYCTCCATMSVGGIYSDHEINYRGIYNNDHRCGFEGAFFVIQTLGDACDEGFVRIQLSVTWNSLTIDREYGLCADGGSPTGMQLMVTATDLEGTQVNYRNMRCEIPGTFVVHEVTDTLVRFTMEGRLSEIGRDYEPTGRTIDLSVEATAIRGADR